MPSISMQLFPNRTQRPEFKYSTWNMDYKTNQCSSTHAICHWSPSRGISEIRFRFSRLWFASAGVACMWSSRKHINSFIFLTKSCFPLVARAILYTSPCSIWSRLPFLISGKQHFMRWGVGHDFGRKTINWITTFRYLSNVPQKPILITTLPLTYFHLSPFQGDVRDIRISGDVEGLVFLLAGQVRL